MKRVFPILGTASTVATAVTLFLIVLSIPTTADLGNWVHVYRGRILVTWLSRVRVTDWQGGNQPPIARARVDWPGIHYEVEPPYEGPPGTFTTFGSLGVSLGYPLAIFSIVPAARVVRWSRRRPIDIAPRGSAEAMHQRLFTIGAAVSLLLGIALAGGCCYVVAGHSWFEIFDSRKFRPSFDSDRRTLYALVFVPEGVMGRYEPPLPPPPPRPPYRRTHYPVHQFVVPYWLVLPAAFVTPALWGLTWQRRRQVLRRRRDRLCPTCGYDLRATPERCPECGTIVAAQRAGGGGEG